ncbi:MAG: type IV pilin protein [Granulosicoccus sp.]|nr:type IV pilin protein [Granulosicoccus sp.]
MNKNKGFTMVELLIVVAIMGIITAIAIPSYSGYVTESRRTDAKTLLLEAAGEQTRFFSENNSYAASMTAMGYSDNSEPTESGHYTVSVTASTASSFTLTATAVGDQTSDTECGNLTINSVGIKTESGTGTNADCW